MNFPTDYVSIRARMDTIDPVAYAASRNYDDGALTYLSPYLSRGVISTSHLMQLLFDKGYAFPQMEKLLQELAWRDYWQLIWKNKGEGINQDIRREQEGVLTHGLAKGVLEANTGIEVIDKKIAELYQSGYMHNHMRMYVAALCTNIAGNHWKIPARWMYYHLLDGDWASNSLSWQWVCGTNSGKKYYANQENINRFFYSKQSGTYLDADYEALKTMKVPGQLYETIAWNEKTELPVAKTVRVNSQLPTLVYNYYNLDPLWHADEPCNRILLLEPSVFEKYPISKHCVDWMLLLGKNIAHLQLFVGEFEELKTLVKGGKVIFKEHPLNKHYEGIEEERAWMFQERGAYPSFFAFWKKCLKELNAKGWIKN